MPSPAMDELIASLHERQSAAAGQPPETVAETRAGFAPAGTVHPIPDDVRVTEVTAAGVKVALAGPSRGRRGPRPPVPARRGLPVRFAGE